MKLQPTKVYEIVDKLSLYQAKGLNIAAVIYADGTSFQVKETNDKYLLSEEELKQIKIQHEIAALEEIIGGISSLYPEYICEFVQIVINKLKKPTEI